jgi:hypothetical protein
MASEEALRAASDQWDLLQEPAERGSAVRKRRDPNWSMHETARLLHVVADPRNATALLKLYQRETNRAELDSSRHEPWSNEFMDLSYDPDFNPDVPEVHGGTVQSVLDKFRPEDVRHVRDGSRLKERWQKIRSAFTIAYKNWLKSGQNDPEEFPTYSQGDDALVYAFCVFHDQSYLDYALRLLPEGTRAEFGVSSVDLSLKRSVLRDPRKTARYTTHSGSASGKESLAECVSSIADALRQPIVLSSQKNTATATIQQEEAASMATALSRLMEVEATLDTKLSELRKMDDYDAAAAERVESRLSVLREDRRHYRNTRFVNYSHDLLKFPPISMEPVYD